MCNKHNTKMSLSEAGKLGSIKSKATQEKQFAERIALYRANPKLCSWCDKVLGYEKRNNKFCSHKCSGRARNAPYKGYSKHIKECDICGKETQNKKFCSQKCSSKNRSLRSRTTSNRSSGSCKKELLEIYGNTCSACGITEWQQKPIVMDLEHIDGDSNNNAMENLCLLCPNCHSQTPTYKGKNVGRGRHLRRVRYAEGKSY